MGTNNLYCLSVLLIITLLTGGTSSSLQELVKVNNEFTLHLYKAVQSFYGGNLIISPISLEVVLAMTMQGANGTTANEISKVLHIDDNYQQVLEGYKTLIGGLQAQTFLKIAGAMFVEKSFPIKPDFENLLTQYFLTGIQKTNFLENPNESRNGINKWVEDKTGGRIIGLFPDGSLDSNSKLVLVNAIHFKADWKIKFNKKYTSLRSFNIKPNVSIDVKMMSLTGYQFRYFWDDKLSAQIVELPYAENEYKMIIIVPDAMFGLAEVESKLASLDLSELFSKMTDTSVDVHIPRFRVKKTLDMGDILSKMGMPTAFTDLADFSRISNESLYISKIMHKAVFIVNERGSEGAAASDHCHWLHVRCPHFQRCSLWTMKKQPIMTVSNKMYDYSNGLSFSKPASGFHLPEKPIN